MATSTPTPIDSVIDFRVEKITHKPTLNSWRVPEGSDSALFLCRVTKIGNHVIDSIPVAVFSRDSEGDFFAIHFLKQTEDY